MLVGYASDSKAYRILLDQSHKIIISRDVVFDEGPLTLDSKTDSESDDDEQATSAGEPAPERQKRGRSPSATSEAAEAEIRAGEHAWGLHQVRDTMTTRPDGTLYHWQVIRFASGREHKQAAKQAEDMS